MEIREIRQEEDMRRSVQVIRQAFLTVAGEFGLTRENAPTNAAFMKQEDFARLCKSNVSLFGMYEATEQVGFFMVEAKENSTYYLNKLAVLPSCRHKGYGKKALEYVFELVREKGGGRISIGIIDENERLKRWYEQYGFVTNVVKSLPHLSFQVCLMVKDI